MNPTKYLSSNLAESTGISRFFRRHTMSSIGGIALPLALAGSIGAAVAGQVVHAQPSIPQQGVPLTEGNGDHGGNGGGGVVDDGIPRTFYDAGIKPKLISDGLEEVPGLEYTFRAIDSLTFLTESTRRQLKTVIAPSPQHLYFELDEGTLSDLTERRLKTEYERVTRIEKDRIAIVAVTQSASRKTFLLPYFGKLENPRSQAAILFHEAYWITHPHATYEQVVGVEVAFEALLEQPKNPARVLKFLKRFGSPGDTFRYALSVDFASRALEGLVSNRKVSAYLLFGPHFLDCSDQMGEGCSALLNEHLTSLIEQYPKSLFLKAFRDQVVPADPHGAVKLWVGHPGFGVQCVDDTGLLGTILRSPHNSCKDTPTDLEKNIVDFKVGVRPMSDLYKILKKVRAISESKRNPVCSDETGFASCTLITLDVRTESVKSERGYALIDVFPIEYMGLKQGNARNFQLLLRDGESIISSEELFDSDDEGMM